MTDDPMLREALLGRTFVELADTLVDDFDVIELLTLVTDRCVEVLDASAAGIMLVADGELRVMASSSEAMRVLELFELQAQEGPCLECHRTALPGRRPRSRPRRRTLAPIRGRGARSRVPVRARAADATAGNDRRGAQPLPGPSRARWAEPDLDAAQALADVATIAILQHDASLHAQVINEQLQHALNSRVVIEQAKGMVAERGELDMEQAFASIRNHARRHNLRLVDLARDIVDGHVGGRRARSTRPQRTSRRHASRMRVE